MSGRYIKTATFAYDASGNRYLVTEEYSYSSGAGYYHDWIYVNDKFYDLQADVDDEEITIRGTYLPFTCVADYESYFTQSPTETMQLVLREAELTGVEITSFLSITLLYVNAGVYEAFGYHVSPKGVTAMKFDINEDYASDVDFTFDIMLAMAELKS